MTVLVLGESVRHVLLQSPSFKIPAAYEHHELELLHVVRLVAPVHCDVLGQGCLSITRMTLDQDAVPPLSLPG